MKTIAAIAAIAATLVAWSAFAATPVPGGKWSFIFTDARGRADRPMRVYTYRPRKCDSTCPMVFVLHGQKRNASEVRDNWQSLADHYSFLVIAPEFTQKNWPKASGYNLGEAGEHKDREKWAFSVVEHLFDEMRVDQASYVLFGHGAGAQFAQRFALLRPDNRASVIVVANAAWYTLPEWRKDKTPAAFPYSLVNAPVGEAELRQALARRLVVMAGDRDDDADDESQDKNDGAVKQGDGRVDRAETFIKSATAAAQALGVTLAWDLVEVPERVHDGEHFGTAAADLLYEKKR
jgi:poly(3-hydroxybutyrate) depolymerase